MISMVSFLSKETEKGEGKKFSGIDKLLQAMLMLGLDDYIKVKKSGMKLNSRLCIQNQAEVWLFSADTWHAFTFLEICEHFGYDPKFIRDMAIKKRAETETIKNDHRRIFR